MLRFDRKQEHSVKQLSFNKKLIGKKSTLCKILFRIKNTNHLLRQGHGFSPWAPKTLHATGTAPECHNCRSPQAPETVPPDERPPWGKPVPRSWRAALLTAGREDAAQPAVSQNIDFKTSHRLGEKPLQSLYLVKNLYPEQIFF